MDYMRFPDAPEGLGSEMHDWITRLFPICRSITGEGLRRSLRMLQEVAPITVSEISSGTKVFDWTVPDEWNISDAFIIGPDGRRVIDFKDSNLHVVGYSVPFRGKLIRKELDEHLFSIPDRPDTIPYVTSYYKRRWGFCLPHRLRESLPDGEYEVVIDSTLRPGSLTFGELVVEGQTTSEILLSTYLCHPSMANDQLSGPVLAAHLARHIIDGPKPRLTYRFVFVPETIGAIAYLSSSLEKLQRSVIGGYVISSVGDSGDFSYIQTRMGDTQTDRLTAHVLKHSGKKFQLVDFLRRGSDERQYCSPGVDLPVGGLMRTFYEDSDVYHTSEDDLTAVTPEAMEQSFSMYLRCLRAFEANRKFRATVPCEPQLSKRDLYPDLGERDVCRSPSRAILDILAFADGTHDLLWIADRAERPIWELAPFAARLEREGLLAAVD